MDLYISHGSNHRMAMATRSFWHLMFYCYVADSKYQSFLLNKYQQTLSHLVDKGPVKTHIPYICVSTPPFLHFFSIRCARFLLHPLHPPFLGRSMILKLCAINLWLGTGTRSCLFLAFPVHDALYGFYLPTPSVSCLMEARNGLLICRFPTIMMTIRTCGPSNNHVITWWNAIYNNEELSDVYIQQFHLTPPTPILESVGL